MAVKLQFRRDTAANWESNNTILSEGELGLDTTNERFKIGDGVNGWNDIEFSQYTNKAETFEASVEIDVSDWIFQTSGDWEGAYIATKNIPGLLPTDRVLVDIDLQNENFQTITNFLGEYTFLFKVETVAIDEIKFYAKDLFSNPIVLNIKVVR